MPRSVPPAARRVGVFFQSSSTKPWPRSRQLQAQEQEWCADVTGCKLGKQQCQ